MTDTVNPAADPAAEQAAAEAAEAAKRAATQAADNASATAASERALKAAREAASKALAALTDLTHSVREQAAALAERVRPQLAYAAGYAKEQPAKTLLASAAQSAKGRRVHSPTDSDRLRSIDKIVSRAVGSVRAIKEHAAQIDIRCRTPSASMALPSPRCTISPRSITRYWSASSAAKS